MAKLEMVKARNNPEKERERERKRKNFERRKEGVSSSYDNHPWFIERNTNKDYDYEDNK